MLLELYEEWSNRILEPFIESSVEEISNIFCVGVPTQKIEQNKKIMIIGQEGNNLGSRGTSSINDMLKWSSGYVDCQIYNINNDKKYNPSPFWEFFRKLKSEGYEVIWNNLDKVHKIVNGQTTKLSSNDETILNQPFGLDQMTLLQKEIKLLNPDAIIFVTGPHYYVSMSTSMNIDPFILQENKPTPKNHTLEISHLIDTKIPIFWTYHPNSLRQQGFFDDSLNEIKGQLKNLE